MKNDAYLADLGIEYLWLQERGPDQFPLDMYFDLVTGTIFLRWPMENVDEAILRVRKASRWNGT